MKQLIRRFRALALLGIQALILQPIKRLRNLKVSGEARFLEAYTPDRLLPLTVEERRRRDRFNACINCGLCDVSCDLLASVRRSRLPSLSSVAVGYGRSMTEYPFARLSLEELSSCDDCLRCEAACPRGVPLKEMIDDLLAHATRLDKAGFGMKRLSAGSGGALELPEKRPLAAAGMEKSE